MIHPLPLGDYNQVGWLTMRERNSLVFGVKACHDAFLILSEHLGNTVGGTFEIVLGTQMDNTSAIFRDGNFVPLVTVPTPGILSCDDMRFFWVSYNTGLISVGYGFTPGTATFMSYDDSENNNGPLDISALSFRGTVESTWAFGELHG